ncbi:MAG: RNA-binding S4 domain-containing protein [Eubacterium sp.]|nr:RNA-binding S4 domain-containing protein [Eubacterium sp.]
MDFKIKQGEEYIKLGQLLKATGLVSSGIEAKIVIQNGEVKVNGEVDLRRGKKVVVGDTVEYSGKHIIVKQ